MWPWEHALAGYIVFSLVVHLFFRRSPSGSETALVGFASLLPDLVDKPLGWYFNLFTSGYGIAHSVFVAVPLSGAVLLFAARRERTGLGLAFATGYLLHLPGDVAPKLLLDGELAIRRILWPIPSGEPSHSHELAGTPVSYFREYAAQIAAGEPVAYVLFGLLAFGAVLWVYDGLPGVREPAGYLFDRK